ncbi:MAG: hypothetical protein ACE5JX_19525 [Acidobacteriota bacterium]
MFGHKIKIDKELCQKVEKCAQTAGYSSVEEFVAHVLEKETARMLDSGGMDAESEEQVRKRLEGLGYIE